MTRTFGDMRDMGVRGLLIYCADYRCSHSIAISGDRWPDHVRLSDIDRRRIFPFKVSRRWETVLFLYSSVALWRAAFTVCTFSVGRFSERDFASGFLYE